MLSRKGLTISNMAIGNRKKIKGNLSLGKSYLVNDWSKIAWKESYWKVLVPGPRKNRRQFSGDKKFSHFSLGKNYLVNDWSMIAQNENYWKVLVPYFQFDLHSWNRTMRQTPVTRNYRLAAIPRMNRLIVYSSSSRLVYVPDGHVEKYTPDGSFWNILPDRSF